MSKYLMHGEPTIGFVSKEMITRFSKKYGTRIPKKCIGIGKGDGLHTIVFWHRCNRWVMVTIRPLTLETARDVAVVLANPKAAMQYIKNKKTLDNSASQT